MFELVPSEYMREYFKAVGFEFTDFQKATLIWNAPKKSWEEKMDALEELAETTKDENLKRQISERICFEKKQLEVFKDNAESRYIYVVEESKESYSCGFFAEYDKAFQYLLKYEKEYEVECAIKKQLVVRTAEDEIVRTHGRGNPYMGVEVEEFSEYDGEAIAEVCINRNGKIIRFYSYELSKEEEEVVSEFKPERFEHAFMKIPFEMQMGTPVKDIVTGAYGILAQDKEEWDDFLRRIEERNLYVDFADIQVTIYTLTETGYWYHEHVNPLYLEIEFPARHPEKKEGNCVNESTEEEKQELWNAWRRAVEALGEYLEHKNRGITYCPDYVLKYAREYAELCRCKSPFYKMVKDAKEPEDILF